MYLCAFCCGVTPVNCLRRPGDSDYDVLGVSPEASEEEIGRAYCRLIEEQGFRIGVPLDRQWARAREIKAAYARLADPVKRQAYDKSLGRTSNSALWAKTSTDAATDELILPGKDLNATEPVENEGSSDASDPSDSQGLSQAPFRSLRVPAGTLEPDLDEGEWFHHDRPPPPYLALPLITPPQNHDQQVPVRSRGMVPAVAIASVLMLVPTLLWWNSQSSPSENSPEVASKASQGSSERPGLNPNTAQAPGDFSRPPAVTPEVQSSSLHGSSASAGPSQPSSPQRAGDVATVQAGEDVSRDTVAAELSAASPAATIPTAPEAPPEPRAADARGTAPAPAPPVSRPSAIASPPPQARTAPGINGASAAVGSSGGRVLRPAKWLGGGPTDADNRGGRYHGTVYVKVTIGPAGRVSNCVPLTRSGSADLDAMTCRIVRERARFSPAFDAQGRPVASQAYTTVVWGRRRRN